MDILKNISQKQKKVIVFAFCAVILIASIIIRFPQDNSVYYDSDASYHTLLTMQAYDETPISTHKFLPLVSLGGEGDKNIPWGETVEHEGTYYYTSFSAASFAAAYFFCKIFFLPFTIQSLYIFSSIIYLVCTGLSVFLALKLFKGKVSEPFLILMTVLILGFQPEILNSLGPVYWAQSLFQIVFLVQLILFQSFDNKKCRIAFYILCVFAPYLEWTGFISNVGFALAFWIKGGIIRDKKFNIKSLKIPMLIAILTVVAGMLFILHFLSVLPFKTVMEALKSRFTARSATADISFLTLFSMYWKSFGLLLPIIAIALIAVLSIKPAKTQFLALLKEYKLIIIASAFAVFENFVLKEHAIVYSYDRMKALIVLFILLMLCYIALRPYLANKNVWIATVFFVISLVNIYRYVYTENFYRTTIDYFEDNKKVAEFFNDNNIESSSVMAQPGATRGYTNLLFGRGVYEYYNEEKVMELAQMTGKRYVILLLPENGLWGVYNYCRFKVFDTQTGFSISFEVINHELTEVKDE